MTAYTIRPITLSRAFSDKGPMTYLVYYSQKIWRPYLFWLIQGAEKNIIVDTAIHAEDYKAYHPGFRDLPIEPFMTFEQGLARASLTPGDIDVVIQTHLHFDHCHNTRQCPSAKIFVQEKELEFASNPHPIFAPMYERSLFEDLDLVTVRGQKTLFPGIEVIPVPGHTPGCQAVAVETKQGRAIITGFCSILENFFPARDLKEKVSPFAGYPVVIPGIHFDAFLAYESVLKIKKLADIILPLHEPAMMDKEVIPTDAE